MIDLVAGAALVLAGPQGRAAASSRAALAVSRALQRLERIANEYGQPGLRRFGSEGGAQRVCTRDDAETADEAELLRGPQAARSRPAIAVVLLTVAIYVLFPKIVGLEDALEQDRGRATRSGSPIALALQRRSPSPPTSRSSAASSARRSSTSPSARATRSRWPAWRRRGCSRPAAPAASCSPTGRCARRGWSGGQSVCRMIAFLVVLYSVYLLALVVFGILLRDGRAARRRAAVGSRSSRRPSPGVGDRDHAADGARCPRTSSGGSTRMTSGRFGRIASRLATAPATFAQGTRTAIAFLRHPTQRRARRRRRDRLLGGATSGSSGRASRRSTSRSRSASSSRGSSSAWSPTSSRSRPAGWGPWTPG